MNDYVISPVRHSTRYDRTGAGTDQYSAYYWVKCHHCEKIVQHSDLISDESELASLIGLYSLTMCNQCEKELAGSIIDWCNETVYSLNPDGSFRGVGACMLDPKHSGKCQSRDLPPEVIAELRRRKEI